MPDEIDDIFNNCDSKEEERVDSSKSELKTVKRKPRRPDLNTSIGDSVKIKNENKRQQNRAVLNPELFFENLINCVESKYCNDNSDDNKATISLNDLRTYDDPDNLLLKGSPVKFGDSIDYHLSNTLKNSLISESNNDKKMKKYESKSSPDSSYQKDNASFQDKYQLVPTISSDTLDNNQIMTNTVSVNGQFNCPNIKNEVVVTDFLDDNLNQVERFAQGMVTTREKYCIQSNYINSSNPFPWNANRSESSPLLNNRRVSQQMQQCIDQTNYDDLEYQTQCVKSLFDSLFKPPPVNRELIKHLRQLAMETIGCQYLPPVEKVHPILVFDSNQNYSFRFFLGCSDRFAATELMNNLNDEIVYCSKRIYQIISLSED